MSKARDALERVNCRGTCADMGEPPCYEVAPNWKACDGCARWATYQLDTLRSAGLVVVPVEPTQEMMKSAEVRLLSGFDENVYRAMIAASQEDKG